MMKRRGALTIPFTSKKDHLIKNPLKIPMAYLSPECEKLEKQVPWTAFTSCKYKSNKSQHKNGSVIVDRSHADFISEEMTRRKPCLILTDVLKTQMGKDYEKRVKMSSFVKKRGRPRKESGGSRKEAPLSKNTRSVQKEAANNNRSKSLPLESNLKTTTPSSQRKGPKKRLKKSQAENKEESQEAEEERIDGGGEEAEERTAEVLECVLSTKPTGDTTSCDELFSDSVKDRLTASETKKQQVLKRKKKPFGSQCNGRSSSKRLCKTVLRLSGEDGGRICFSGDDGVEASFSGGDGIDGEQGPASVSQEDSEEHMDLENIDRCILQFTVGGDDGTDTLVPVISPSVESMLDGTTQTSPSEPIVLSSDDDESDKSQRSREVILPVSDTVMQESASKWAAAPDPQGMQEVVDEPRHSAPASPLPEVDYSCLSVAFCSLRCGGYKARANGGLMIAQNKIIIPLKDASEQQNRMVSFERRELRRYSIWTQQELEAWEVNFDGDEEAFFGILLLYVSETAAVALREDLSQLCAKDDGFINTEKASPFILLTLKDPLEGMEGALLRSVLDLDCIKSMTEILSANCEDEHFSLEDLDTPVLSLDSSIELIRKTGLDSHLFYILGIKSSEGEPEEERNSLDYDVDEIPTAHIGLDTDLQKGSSPEPDPEEDTEEDTETPVEPEEDQKQEEAEKSPDSPKEEAQPVYTVCHRRTKDSYSVSLQKPDSNWIKFKYRGLAQRLIQFPPPPLKGGITVTMEDLRCLDNGQYLNDVIIDFYVKYLIQNASADITERCHIFSSFFFKQLTRRDNASEGVKNDACQSSCQRQRRHQRVKTWTRHVDIFEKDFLFVPVNQESHWYLVVICFPGLEEAKVEGWTGELDDQDESRDSKSSEDDAETAATQKTSDGVDSETDKNQEKSTTKPQPCQISCTQLTCQKKIVYKRPCILIMDSLKLSLHERVFKLLREYLQSEWEARRGSSRDFGPDQMKSSHCKVPLQDNSSDCGLYLLQYVECFLKDPVVHFDLPLHLQQWFPRQLIRKKRDKIRDLILNLYRHQNPENNKK